MLKLKTYIMNTEAFWTIIGVIVGALLTWILEELSQINRFRGERRILSRISQLYKK